MTEALILTRQKVARRSTPSAQIIERLQREIKKIGARFHHGRLDVTLPSGRIMHFGNSGPKAELTLHDWGALSALAAKGDIGWGEAYVAGLWDSPDIEALAALALQNGEAFGDAFQPSMARRVAFLLTDRILRRNSRAGSARNIRAHYDVGDDFYSLWLDEGMNYSSAIFAGGDDVDLDGGQSRKHQRLLDATAAAGPRVLEIGCGWGGFAAAAADAGRDVTAITSWLMQAKHWAIALMLSSVTTGTLRGNSIALFPSK